MRYAKKCFRYAPVPKVLEHTENTFCKSHLHISHFHKFVFVIWILTENTNHKSNISLNSIFIIRQSSCFLDFFTYCLPTEKMNIAYNREKISQWREQPQVKFFLCKCVNAICVDGRRGSLVDQDLCNLHIICVNLHKFLHQAVEKMCKCVNAICEMCFRYAPYKKGTVVILLFG